MSPRSLLFCSSRETSQLLSRFLRDLRFEVEHCPEIFEAVKRLTAHPHELVVIDWDEGLEASFLLKTIRELKSNRDAFVIALAKPEAVAAVRQAGANEVVTKAQVSEEIKNSWVSSRDFLAGLERRFAPPGKPVARPQVRPVITLPNHLALPNHPALPNRLPVAIEPPPPLDPLPTQPIAAMVEQDYPVPVYDVRQNDVRQNDLRENDARHNPPPVNLTFAALDTETSLPAALLHAMSKGLGRLNFLGSFHSRRNTFLRRVAMVIAFFTVGYVASQPLSHAGASIAEIYQEAVGIQPIARHSSRTEARPAAGIQQASLMTPALPSARPAAEESQADDSQMNVEVTPLYHNPVTHDAVVRSAPRLVDTSVASDSPEYPEPPQRASSVPDSLSSQFPASAAIRNVAEKISPAILGALEPVNLPGYLADKLLVQRVEPSYPSQALRSGVEGPVVLQAWIGKDGKIRNLKLVRGPLLLGEAAYQAVRQWRYQPYLLNGEAVEAQTYVTLDFKLP